MTDSPYSVASLAERWGCSKRHISNMVKRGELTPFKIGKQMRFRPEEVGRVECGTGSPSTKEGSSRSSTMTEAVASELRLRRLSKAWKFMQKEKARANEEARVWFERLKTAEAEGARLKKSIAEDYWPIPKECD